MPPLSVSLPVPPEIRSRPARPLTVSLPPDGEMRSGPLVPTNVSLRLVPIIASRPRSSRTQRTDADVPAGHSSGVPGVPGAPASGEPGAGKAGKAGKAVISQFAWMSGSGAGPWQVSVPRPPSRVS